MVNKLIAHSLIKYHEKYLVIKRVATSYGRNNVYPSYWDIPGGSVESEELPKGAAIRECLEEVGLQIKIDDIIHEDSNLDNGVVYTRLVYAAHLPKNKEISVTLNPEEHIDYRWISVLFISFYIILSIFLSVRSLLICCSFGILQVLFGVFF